jgi:hypothetical protein
VTPGHERLTRALAVDVVASAEAVEAARRGRGDGRDPAAGFASAPPKAIRGHPEPIALWTYSAPPGVPSTAGAGMVP